MKKSIIISSVLVVVALAVNAQNFDRSYSAANYKMPNKAKKAAALNLDNATIVAYAAGEQVAFDNYKNSFAGVQANGGQMPIIPVAESIAAANYKAQFKAINAESIAAPAKQEPVVINHTF